MVFVNVYRQPLYRSYKGDFFSIAFLVQFIVFGLIIAIPIALVAINTGKQF